ncbi:uncharacterized protein [Scyliorhinus torazame]|uniref:uncharacterized protein isoform X1 n=2 Tax=Scyliorhinus torazame TaxID=75743 RepID=UPI003B5A805C
MPHRCSVHDYEDGTVKNCFISGKTFYLDLPSNKNTKFLEEVVKKWGGTIESFLSKEVSYVISNNKGSKLANLAPIPNREHLKNNQVGTPQSANPRDDQIMQISRGKRLLETVIRNNECAGTNSILDNARSWGVKILYLDDLLAYFAKRGIKLLNANRKTEGNGHSRKYICKNTKVGKLKQPFLKIEDSSRHFRPLFQQYVSYPELNYKSHKGFSAFDPLKKSRNGHQEQEKSKHGDCRMTNSEGDVESITKPIATHRENKRQRFCECCRETYYDLVGHLISKQHQEFASDPSQFTVIDDIVAQLENEFVEYQSSESTQRSMKSVSSSGSSLSKIYMESLQAVNDLVLEGEKLSLESVTASQLVHLPVEDLERIDENGQNSKVHDVKSGKAEDELIQERLELNGHRSCSLQQDHELASLSSFNQIAVYSKQLLVKSPNCSSLDFNTGVPAERATSYIPNEQMDARDTFVQRVSYGFNGEISESCHRDEKQHMESEEIPCCVEANSDSWKMDCDIVTTDTNCSYKKRKRSDNTSSQIKRSPRCKLDDLTVGGDCFSFSKSNNCYFNEHIFQPHADLLYLSDLDKIFTSHTFVEQTMFPSTCSMNISMRDHFDLSAKFNLHEPLNSKESLVDHQSCSAKNECENLEKPQRAIWTCEEKTSSLPNTLSTASQELKEEIWCIHPRNTLLHDKEQKTIPLSSAAGQAGKALLSAPPHAESVAPQSNQSGLNDETLLKDKAEIQTDEEIEHTNVAGNTIMRLFSSFETKAHKSLGSDTLQCKKATFQVDESQCKNSVNQTNLCHSSFKNSIFLTDISSSESEWDIQLSSRLSNIQASTKEQSIDLELLRKTCVNVKDSKYETRLHSVLKDKAEADRIKKEGITSCQTKTSPPCYLTLVPYLDSYTN